MAAFLLLAALVVGVIILRGKANFAPLRGDKDFNIILITLDTTRADRLGDFRRSEESATKAPELAKSPSDCQELAGRARS